ncbi:MAG: class I SAM-dependent methyltransferase [Candidatus Hydrogenedentes bacterium]|nr:class I SAM-dependent methyltransferase [Candidatus Hydrogenedentota bacterium]
MNRTPQQTNLQFFQRFWKGDIQVYESHPTSRHRRRFVLESLRRLAVTSELFLFDYGCGSGAVLRDAKALLQLRDAQLGGCDLSPEAIEIVQRQFQSPDFFVGSYPELTRPIDVAVCTEVIEHTPEYSLILEWLHRHLKPGGMLILTTPSVPMDPPDATYGHTQHFVLAELRVLLEDIGFHIEYAARWGFPFFTLQKYITARCYRQIEKHVLDTPLSPSKRALFALVYYLYFIHDFIPLGPQIFIRARCKPREAPHK